MAVIGILHELQAIREAAEAVGDIIIGALVLRCYVITVVDKGVLLIRRNNGALNRPFTGRQTQHRA